MAQKPNIVYFFVDDMGYGDVSCMNPNGKIPTPNFDKLAEEGMIFTDAHSASAVCSPSRYSVLTGRYSWRSTLQRGIVNHYGDALIKKDQLTVPALLKQHGYQTACIGKWHLGMTWQFDLDNDFYYPQDKADDHITPTDQQKQKWSKAFAKPTTDGPTTRGFDYYFGVDVPNWPPYCFIENDRTVGTPSEFLPKRLIGNNLASFGGPAMPYWHFEQLLPTWADKADQYIKDRAKDNTPFFLYLPMTSPHTPLSVNKPWIGKSGLNNLYADLVMETDDIFGQVMKSLKDNNLDDNTLVVFASDNGCADYIGVSEMQAQGHFPSAHFRGYKADIWDGGHRIPLIIKWPGQIKPGTKSDQLVCLSDFIATIAEHLDTDLPDNSAQDSFSMMPIFQDQTNPIRDHCINHSSDGKFAIRDKQWKLVLCPGSGSWTVPDAKAAEAGLPLLQLYNMANDPSEKNNLYKDHPDRVKKMLNQLKDIVAAGRSTPGPQLQNDTEVDIWKLNTMPAIDPKALDDY